MNDKTCGTCSHGLRNIVYCETKGDASDGARQTKNSHKGGHA